MATGTPSSKREQPSTCSLDEVQVKLVYPNKQSISNILAIPPGSFRSRTGIGQPNRLYFSENLSALSALTQDSSVCGKVRLVYIDPPYATQTTFHSRTQVHAYEDVFGEAEYLEFLRKRLIFLHKLLSSDGSIYVHIDDKMLFHVKLILDEIFGPENYRNCITRKKCNPKNYTRKSYGNVSDYILFYTKSETYVWNRQFEAWTEERAKEYQYIDEFTGRRHMRVPVHAPGTRNGETGKPWRGKLPPLGKHWQFPPSKLDELDAKGEIHWSKNGNPRRKVFLDTNEGIPVQDIWMDFKDAHNQNICITGYPTEKNPDLLRRIVEASSRPGDLVLDCFSGSGTTLAAADDLGRSWIGIDSSPEAIRTTLQRFATGLKAMGDFVTTTEDFVHPTLFDLIDAPKQLVISTAKAITNFDLFADDATLDSLASLDPSSSVEPIIEHLKSA
jgi:adenine-specific DNA-methyltransferase